MTDLYLIAHRVRSEPAFDIATQVPCAECQGQVGDDYIACSECDSLGFWWVVPTSGHRAYPWWSAELTDNAMSDAGFTPIPPMPPSLSDHYTTRASPTRQSLASLLAIPRPQLKVDRRF